MSNILYLALCTPLVGGFIVIFLPKNDFYLIRDVSFTASLLTFLWCLTLWVKFDYINSNFQFVYFSREYLLKEFYLQFLLGVDGFSMVFILLTSFIFPLCFWSIYNKDIVFFNVYVSFFLFLEFSVLGTFLSLDLLLFFIFFEIILIPMIFIIGIWGSTLRKIRAMYLFLIYTAFGSAFILFAIFLLILDKQSVNFYYLFYSTMPLAKDKQILLCFLFFIGFSVKIPIFPLHIWLPEAHVEAPTEGSIILASLLLKLGGYGLLRTSLPICPNANFFFLPIIYTFCLFGIIFCSFIALRQNDLKKIIAYSSVAHMNIVVLGIFSMNIQGIQGSVFLMVGHALASTGLFFLIGCLYDRHKNRLLNYYGGLVQSMPIFSSFFFFFTLCNFSFPGTPNFIGEILILVGVFEINTFAMFWATISSVITVTYSIWLFNRLVFGTMRLNYIKYFTDVQLWEFEILFYTTVSAIVIGLQPNYVLDISNFSCLHLIQFYNFGCIA